MLSFDFGMLDHSEGGALGSMNNLDQTFTAGISSFVFNRTHHPAQFLHCWNQEEIEQKITKFTKGMVITRLWRKLNPSWSSCASVQISQRHNHDQEAMDSSRKTQFLHCRNQEEIEQKTTKFTKTLRQAQGRGTVISRLWRKLNPSWSSCASVQISQRHNHDQEAMDSSRKTQFLHFRNREEIEQKITKFTKGKVITRLWRKLNPSWPSCASVQISNFFFSELTLGGERR